MSYNIDTDKQLALKLDVLDIFNLSTCSTYLNRLLSSSFWQSRLAIYNGSNLSIQQSITIQYLLSTLNSQYEVFSVLLINGYTDMALEKLKRSKISHYIIELVCKYNSLELVTYIYKQYRYRNIYKHILKCSCIYKKAEIVNYILAESVVYANAIEIIKKLVKNNSADILELFIAHGVDFSNIYIHLLRIATKNDSDAIIELLLGVSTNLFAEMDNMLIISTRKQILNKRINYSFLSFLLAKGANPRDRNLKALQVACKWPNADVFSFLLDASGGFRVEDVELVSAAIYNGNVAVLELLELKGLTYTNPNITLKNACISNSVYVLRHLISKGLELDKKEDFYISEAAKNGNIELMEVLLENGACISKKALFKAIRFNKADSVAFLLDAGIDVNCLNGYPLSLAINMNNLYMVKLLLVAGANPNLNKSFGLALAIIYKYKPIIELLMLNGAEISNFTICRILNTKDITNVQYLEKLGVKRSTIIELAKNIGISLKY